MSSLPKIEKEPPRRRHALFFTFASFIALGGLMAFYFTSVFDFQWDSFPSPVKQEALRPASTVIHFHSDTPITVVAEEFDPHSTVPVPVVSAASPTIPPLAPSNTSNSQAPAKSTPSETAVDFTDPFNVTRNVFYGPWRAEIPQTVIAGEQFEMTLFCTNPDQSLCPPYYRVFFLGPSRQTVLPLNFTKAQRMYNPPYDYGNVTGTWTIRDPGEYMVYAYPEFSFCAMWKQMEWPWYKAAVQGVPMKLEVLASTAIDMEPEGYGTCSPDEVTNGRFLSTDPSISPSEFTDMYQHAGQEFAWAPYSCKIPHRNVSEAIKAMPLAQHFVWFGDSTTRGPFCTKVWEHVHGDVIGSVCDYKSGTTPYWEMKWGHKYTHKVFEIDGEQRNISFSFIWTPDNLNTILAPMLDLKDPPPTHVIFNMGIWISSADYDELYKRYWDFLELMKKHYTGVVQHVILKTTVSVVHQVQCFGKQVTYDYNEKDEIQAPAESSVYRYGEAKVRFAIYSVAKNWNAMYKENPPFRVSVVDAWLLTDHRPETTSEGRHWIAEDKKLKLLRSGIGEADDSILDLTWDEFVNERMTI